MNHIDPVKGEGITGRLDTVSDHCLFFVEEAEDRTGKDGHQPTGNNGDSDSHCNTDQCPLLYPFHVSCAGILTGKRCGCLSESRNGIVDGKLRLKINSECRNGIHIKSIDLVLDQHIGKLDDQTLEPGRYADGKDPFCTVPVRPDASDMQAIRFFLPKQKNKRQKCCRRLGQECGHGRSKDSPAQPCHKHGIHSHIDDSADQLDHHRHSGIPRGTDDPGTHVKGHNGKQSAKIEPQIGRCVQKNLLRNMKPGKQHRSQKDSKHRQNRSAEKSQKDSRMNCLFCPGHILCADPLCRHHPGSHTDTGKESHHAGHQNPAGADGRRSILSNQIPHKQKIHRVVKLLDQAGAKKRQGKKQQLLPDHPLCQIHCFSGCLFHTPPPAVLYRSFLRAKSVPEHFSSDTTARRDSFSCGPVTCFFLYFLFLLHGHCHRIQMPDLIDILLDGPVRAELSGAGYIEDRSLCPPGPVTVSGVHTLLGICIGTEIL